VAVTTTTSANDYVLAADLLASRILPNFYGSNSAGHLVRYETIAGAPSKAANFPISGALAANGLTEGSDAAYTQYSTDVVTLTVAEAGLVLAISDLLAASDIVGLDHYADQASQALANKVTVDILALATGLNGGTAAGSTGVALSELNIIDAVTTLAANNIPGPFHGILHPQQWNDLAVGVGASLNPLNAPGSQNTYQTSNDLTSPIFDGGMREMYGVQWTVSGNVPLANAGADRAGMIVNPRYAIGWLDKWGARTEFERDASGRLTEIVITAAYAVGELRDTAGIAVVTDA
jgi:hypothetical protein